MSDPFSLGGYQGIMTEITATGEVSINWKFVELCAVSTQTDLHSDRARYTAKLLLAVRDGTYKELP